ncbi:unnamed protein product [Medioppia subpectinata]|uniref:Uncharacterized protein n=1 Tax=Medioppia subpectinata TaxID=1979941 RepID=A0A7R9Q511_9ACAR|nr:unnamed protein product [Medioppia subpectinata]CAG2112260.1 unnamed protein product [Medioppia subpectinata]
MVYCMAKSALDMFTKCLALSLGPKGIRVNSVNPAAIRTPIFQTVTENDEMLDCVEKYCKTAYPLRRIGEPEEVAELVAFLASDTTASFITGALIPIDGGSLRADLSAIDYINL